MSYRRLAIVMCVFVLLAVVAIVQATGSVLVLEAESGTGLGINIMQRSNASQNRTAHVSSGETLRLPFQVSADRYGIVLRYSNDNFGPSETVKVRVDGNLLYQFTARDTGSGGFGWNSFVNSRWILTPRLAGGSHILRISVSGGDGYGIEFDKIVIAPWN